MQQMKQGGAVAGFPGAMGFGMAPFTQVGGHESACEGARPLPAHPALAGHLCTSLPVG
jgi:hypothetical protein